MDIQAQADEAAKQVLDLLGSDYYIAFTVAADSIGSLEARDKSVIGRLFKKQDMKPAAYRESLPITAEELASPSQGAAVKKLREWLSDTIGREVVRPPQNGYPGQDRAGRIIPAPNGEKRR